ncbi:MerC domain-containing protein [Novosphingobium sp. Chol11]|uniref:MerC domain-containing protein n=1 Tax=Novosphingobium sp. Chol11 TaxID=1385763 RepID=UPI0025CE1996|nr:MerC domain-containing protein [Novosphingobium sp. Chol11]
MNDAMFGLRGRLDRVGVVLSGLCMVHCLAGLFLIGAFGLGGSVLFDPAIHRFGLVIAFALGVITIGMNAVRHGHRLPLALGGGGVLLMGSAILAGHSAFEAALTIGGVLLVAAAHMINLRRTH